MSSDEESLDDDEFENDNRPAVLPSDNLTSNQMQMDAISASIESLKLDSASTIDGSLPLSTAMSSPSPFMSQSTPSTSSIGSSESLSETGSIRGRLGLRGTPSMYTAPPAVHMMGYYLESLPNDPNATSVTCISQFSSKALAKAEVTLESSKALRDFLHTLDSFLKREGQPGDSAKGTTGNLESDARSGNVDGLRAGIGWTKQKLMSSRTASWLYGRRQDPGATIPSPSPSSSVYSAPDTYSEKFLSWRQSANFDFVVESDDAIMFDLECNLKSGEGGETLPSDQVIREQFYIRCDSFVSDCGASSDSITTVEPPGSHQ
ncbi:hypothetical protein M427DRAFT_365934 [Gonapodya prolifera JEL478]|uniref:Uncharacterized protein n=1 Tax=Gonapodya prolifera (strain JEL478) TaxID=1344416 RepID=A0A139AA19_GONPJ|nr:hypothetical protein M427DRAFT_365934 [Gonapodya prolifera JEL478]|eukprot:KXS13651.1 hypothetical protein M427DRAFT_365934 [Gonapodya prolifera JEL478]